MAEVVGSGLGACAVPVELGGGGVRLPSDVMAVVVELARHDGSIALITNMHFGGVRTLRSLPDIPLAQELSIIGEWTDRARRHHGDQTGLSFEIGDAKATGLDAASVDLVLMHTLLCHVPEPKDVVVEAFRVLKPGGILAICDGDYDTATAQIADFDPLDQLIRFMINQNATNLWIMRQITGILSGVGFELGAAQGHGYVAEGEATYFLTVIDRGADRMVESGLLFRETADALKAEARARVKAKTFYGFMSYVSQIARKP